jgi:LacI family transcriptional regulator
VGEKLPSIHLGTLYHQLIGMSNNVIVFLRRHWSLPTRLKDIARSLNLSISTVSAALQNRPDISSTTRERVLKKVRELNYHPNSLARSLVTQRTHVLGVVVPDLSRSFFAEVTMGIDMVTSAAGYSLLICNTGEDAAREDRELGGLLSQQVEGLFVASAHRPNSSLFCNRLADSGVPFVLIDRRFPKAHFVGCDDERIGYVATKHLIEQGYRRVAHLSGPQNISTAIGRHKGYLKALRQFSLTLPEEYIVEAPYHRESGGFDAMQRLLRLSEPPDAVFAASDPIAIGALQAILRAGLEPGPKVGLIGVGNHRYGDVLAVPLSTVDQRRAEIGRTAASLLLQLIRDTGFKEMQSILIEPELVIRASSTRVSLRHQPIWSPRQEEQPASG